MGKGTGRDEGYTLREQLLVEVRSLAPAIQVAILGWIKVNARDYPWRRLGVTPFEVLVAEILLKRTTATAASRVYHSIITKYPNLAALAMASEEAIAEDLVTIGLQAQRARDLKRLAEYVSEKERGKIPKDLKQLLKVPGLGGYSARAILSFGYGIMTAVVDSNVERILRRVFRDCMPEKISRELFQAMADELLPETDHRGFNLGLLDLGAIVCRYTRPKCDKCPLAFLCDSAHC